MAEISEQVKVLDGVVGIGSATMPS